MSDFENMLENYIKENFLSEIEKQKGVANYLPIDRESWGKYFYRGKFEHENIREKIFWKTKEGKKILISKIEDSHLHNLAKFVCKSPNLEKKWKAIFENEITYRNNLSPIDSIKKRYLFGDVTKEEVERYVEYLDIKNIPTRYTKWLDEDFVDKFFYDLDLVAIFSSPKTREFSSDFIYNFIKRLFLTKFVEGKHIVTKIVRYNKNLNEEILELILNNKECNSNYKRMMLELICLNENFTLTEKFVEKYQDFIDWSLITNSNLSQSFIEKFEDKIFWRKVGNQELTDDFILKNRHRVNWDLVLHKWKVKRYF